MHIVKLLHRLVSLKKFTRYSFPYPWVCHWCINKSSRRCDGLTVSITRFTRRAWPCNPLIAKSYLWFTFLSIFTLLNVTVKEFIIQGWLEGGSMLCIIVNLADSFLLICFNHLLSIPFRRVAVWIFAIVKDVHLKLQPWRRKWRESDIQ